MFRPRASRTKVPALANASRSPPLRSTRGRARSSANATDQPRKVRWAAGRRSHGTAKPNTRAGLATASTGAATKAGGWSESGASSTGVVLMLRRGRRSCALWSLHPDETIRPEHEHEDQDREDDHVRPGIADELTTQ